jgi:hypothetical protein
MPKAKKKTKKPKKKAGKKPKKKPVIKITEIKPKKEESESAEAELEEKTDEAEEEVRSVGFQNFIKTSTLTPTLTPVETLATDPVSLDDPGFATETSSAREREQENIEDYVIPEDATLETYREMIREQNRASREVQALSPEVVDIEKLGRERQTIGTEAHFQQFHELQGGSDEYEVLLPGQKGFETGADKSTIPFEEASKKTYVEKMRE